MGAPALGRDVEEALRRGGVVWVSLDGGPARAVWHVWRDGAVHLVCGGGEQELPGAAQATSALMTVRGRGEDRGPVATLSAAVERPAPGTAEWDAAVELLVPERLNAVDVDALPAAWARESTVLRLRPA